MTTGDNRRGRRAAPSSLREDTIVADTASGQARRRFLRLAAAGMVAMPLCGGYLVHRARAQERVAEDNELAQRLGYKHDASEVDPNEWPGYQEGHICANCRLYHGADGDEWGPCDLFAGMLVNTNGWCKSWIERQA